MWWWLVDEGGGGAFFLPSGGDFFWRNKSAATFGSQPIAPNLFGLCKPCLSLAPWRVSVVRIGSSRVDRRARALETHFNPYPVDRIAWLVLTCWRSKIEDVSKRFCDKPSRTRRTNSQKISEALGFNVMHRRLTSSSLHAPRTKTPKANLPCAKRSAFTSFVLWKKPRIGNYLTAFTIGTDEGNGRIGRPASAQTCIIKIHESQSFLKWKGRFVFCVNFGRYVLVRLLPSYNLLDK